MSQRSSSAWPWICALLAVVASILGLQKVKEIEDTAAPIFQEISRRERIAAGGERSLFPYDNANEQTFRSIPNDTLSLTAQTFEAHYETWTTRRDFAFIAVGVFGVVGIVLRLTAKRAR